MFSLGLKVIALKMNFFIAILLVFLLKVSHFIEVCFSKERADCTFSLFLQVLISIFSFLIAELMLYYEFILAMRFSMINLLIIHVASAFTISFLLTQILDY